MKHALSALGLQYFVMYIIFNDDSRFVLSNIYQLLLPYYTEGFYKQDFSYQPAIIHAGDHYLCDRTKSITEDFKAELEERFGVHRAYYIVRPYTECTFVFGAIKGRKFDNCIDIYRSTIKGFEIFCAHFVESFLEIIRDYNPHYKNSFILTNPQLRKAVITGGYPKESDLTGREIECLWWASKGKSTKEVAKILGLSPETVATHNKRIREKLNCSTMIEAVVEGIHRGLIGKINPAIEKKNYKIDDFKIVNNMNIATQEISKTNLALLNGI